MAQDAAGMRWYRFRNQNGELRQKRGDTHIWTIEQKYKIDVNVRSDMHLKTFLENNNIESLNDLITWN